MKAAIAREFGGPLSIEELPDPTPGPGEVVVDIEASGLCHTDIHAVNGDWPVKPKMPLIPGHEGVGKVSAVGAGVTHISEGERVALPWLGWACGVCDYCVSGWETLCTKQVNTGYGIDGAYATRAKASAAYVGKVPDGVDSFAAAPLTCAGVTTYKAVKVSDVKPTDLVAVFGIGGLGHLAMQYATVFGGTVVAVDLKEPKLQLARRLGATYTVNAAEQDAAAAIQELGGADVAIALATSPRAFEQAYRSLRRGGRLTFVALPADNEVPLPIFETVLQGITLKGSIVGTRADLEETFALHADGRTEVVYERSELEHVNEDFAAVERGEVEARRVFAL